MGFDVAFHHMGRFERNRGLKYVGGEIHVVKGIDLDFWLFFEALGIVKEFKYGGDVKLWWKGSKKSLLNNLRLLSDDKEVIVLANFAEESKEEVHIYVQHVPSQPEIVHFIGGVDEVVCEDEGLGEKEVIAEEEVVVKEVVIGEQDVVREAEVNGEEAVIGEEDVVREAEVNGEEDVVDEQVQAEEEEDLPKDRLDDSEEERMTDDDDGFGMDNNSSHGKIGRIGG